MGHIIPPSTSCDLITERQEKKAAFNRTHGIDPTKPKVSTVVELKSVLITAKEETKISAKGPLQFYPRGRSVSLRPKKVLLACQLCCFGGSWSWEQQDRW